MILYKFEDPRKEVKSEILNLSGVDAHVSGACIRKDVGVRLPPAAQKPAVRLPVFFIIAPLSIVPKLLPFTF